MKKLAQFIFVLLFSFSAIAVEKNENYFGEELFEGKFAEQSFSGFNPNYQIAIGDILLVQIWGGTTFSGELPVDQQGNIFIPKVGPIHVRGTINENLNSLITKRVKQVFQKNVRVYASLSAAQPVKVYVTGGVVAPGLYAGLSSDSILHFLDKAQGIKGNKGSYINVELLRAGQSVATFNLYEFLNTGRFAKHQMRDGDVILVHPRRYYVSISGTASFSGQKELSSQTILLTALIDSLQLEPTTSHVRLVRNSQLTKEVEYIALNNLPNVEVKHGDDVFFVSDKKASTISVRVEGEHAGQHEFILPHGSTLSSLLNEIKMNDLSDMSGLQLFRKSTQIRQKEMLLSSLQSLESSVLTARSETAEAAALRTREAELVLQWVERAKQIEPRGQVILANRNVFDRFTLENGDVIKVPAVSSLVLVHGEVVFPSAITFDDNMNAADYVSAVGGYTQNEESSYVVIMKKNGQFIKIEAEDSSKLRKQEIIAGDEIFVLPKVDEKYLQFGKDITQVIYQIAVSAAVVLGV